MIQTNSTIKSNGGNISFDSPVILTGATTVFTDLTGSIQFHQSTPAHTNATIDSLDSVTAQPLTLTAGTGGITLSGVVGASHPLGTLTADSANGVTFNANVTTNAAIDVNADTDQTGSGTFTVGSNAAVVTTNHDLSIAAQDVTLAGTLNSGSTATTTITTTTLTGETIGLGSTSGSMTISGAELQNISAHTLVLGDPNAATSTTTGMTVNGITSTESANIGTLALNALQPQGASISFATNSSTFQTLVATAKAGHRIRPRTDSDGRGPCHEGLTFTAQNGTMHDSGALTLNAVDGVTLNNNLTSNGNLTTGGALLINADTDNDGAGTLTVAGGLLVKTTGNSNLTAIFGTLDLTGTFVSTGIAGTNTTTTTLSPPTLQTIGIGLASGIAPANRQFMADSTLLGKITAENLTIGGTLNGNITVDGFVPGDAPHIPGTITLLAESTTANIRFVNHASTFDQLSASADNGIQVQQNLTTVGASGPPAVAGNLTLDGDADNTAAAGATANNLVFSPNVILTAGGPAGRGHYAGGEDRWNDRHRRPDARRQRRSDDQQQPDDGNRGPRRPTDDQR